MKALAAFLVIGLVACSHAQPAPEAAVTTPQPPPAAAPAPAQPPPERPAAPPVAVPTGSIYFDFDKSDLKPPSEELLSRLGPILEQHPDLKLRIEGNCDERGSEEYNIALGQRRADSAKNYLVRLGARADQINTISYGENRPRAKGHDEEAWRQNRRDDFVPSQATVAAEPASK